MNQTEYAAHRGVSRPYISKLVRLGKIEVVDGQIDPDEADAALARNSDPGKDGVRASNAKRKGQPDLVDRAQHDESYNDAQKRNAKAVADLREMEVAQKRGDLIEMAAYAKGCADAGYALGKELDGIVNRLAAVVAGESNIARCRELIGAEIFRARTTMADTLEALAADPRDGTKQ